MTAKEAVNWITNIMADIGKSEHSDLWHYEQALTEIREMLEFDAQQWIPCNERLPEYGQPVLTWDGTCYFVEKRIPVIRDDNGEPIEGGWWVSDDYDEYESDYYPNLRDGACVAWMPLPEPWKGEQE